MIHVSRTPEFSNCGNLNSVSIHTSSDQDMNSMAGGRSRQRSQSYHNADDKKNYGLQTQTEETHLRPRSRYVFNSVNGNVDLNVWYKYGKILWQANNSLHKNVLNKVMIITEYIINTMICLLGHFTVMRHQTFTPTMTWGALTGPVHWDRGQAPYCSIK